MSGNASRTAGRPDAATEVLPVESAADRTRDREPALPDEPMYKQPAKCVACVWGRWEASRQFCMMPTCIRGDAGPQEESGEIEAAASVPENECPGDDDERRRHEA